MKSLSENWSDVETLKTDAESPSKESTPVRVSTALEIDPTEPVKVFSYLRLAKIQRTRAKSGNHPPQQKESF